MTHRAVIIAVLVAMLAIAVADAPATPTPEPAQHWQDKVDPWVLETGAQGPTEFLVFLEDQADLSAASRLTTKLERGDYVYRTLTRHADRTQGPLRRRLAELGVEYRPYWVANMIWVRGGLDVVRTLAQRADVARINANPQVKLDVISASEPATTAPDAPEAVEWNITKVRAPDVWATGVKGAGAVIGGQDTGYRWTHNALKPKYRGWNGATANHDYNWHDAIHNPGSSCGADSPQPCDDYGHGTHTMGTMVGDDGAGNQVGMAPDAKWIGCRNMNDGVGTPTTYSECYQWFIAPTKMDGTDADPSKAPDVINNSWGCPPDEGCTDPNALLTVVQNVRAAGIVTVHSAGNSGSSCGTVADPAAIYAESFSVGATTNTPNDDIASYSSRGPVTIDGSYRMKPNIAAPGSGVRSSNYSSDGAYSSMSGTSMAGPHVAGLVALIISADPSLRGDVDGIEDLIEQSAVRRTTAQGCGGDSSTAVPNNVFGWGRIDAYAATCGGLPAAITDLAVQKLTSTDLQLTWSAKAHATGYYVRWGASPQFEPGPSCEASSCESVVTTSFSQGALGDTNTNFTYVVQARNRCGQTQSAPSNRVGEFGFPLGRGLP